MLSTDAAALRRAALAFDVVQFVAPCPACGVDAVWDQRREDTRLRTMITCAEPACRADLPQAAPGRTAA